MILNFFLKFIETLNELMDMVSRLLSPVINCNVTVPTFEYHPYKQDQLQV